MDYNKTSTLVKSAHGKGKDMKLKISIFCEWALLGSLAAMAVFAVLPGFWMDLGFRLLLALIQSAAALAAAFGRGGGWDSKVRRAARLLLAIYLTHLIGLLFFDGEFGRHHTFSLENWRLRTNLRPFATIGVYWRGVARGWVGLRIAVINLLGNLLALAPLGALLPFAWDRMKRKAPSLALGAVSIVLIEVTQLLTGCGSCDIDDFILNFTGFLLARLAVQPLLAGKVSQIGQRRRA